LKFNPKIDLERKRNFAEVYAQKDVNIAPVLVIVNPIGIVIDESYTYTAVLCICR